MSPRAVRWTAWLIATLCIVAAAASVWLFVTAPSVTSNYVLWSAAMAVSFPTVGAVILTSRPRNAIGWLYSAVGASVAVAAVVVAYAPYGLLDAPEPLPGATFASWMYVWAWLPSFGLFLTFGLLLFPDGRLPSPRWRWVARLAGASIALGTLDMALFTWAERGPALVEATGQPGSPLVYVWHAGVFGAAVLSAASLFARYRTAGAQERMQLKWMAYAGALTVLIVVPSGAVAQNDSPPLLSTVGVVLIPIAAGIAIVRHRLYDIDLVISKTIVFGGLAAFITAVYVAFVVGVGALIGTGEEPNLMLSIAATALVAVAFQPARQRLQHVANRLVYGLRATPYEVLSQFSARMGETVAVEESLERMAGLLADGTGAERAEVWLRVGGDLRLAASSPSTADEKVEPLAMEQDRLPEFPTAGHAVPVIHHGELLGALMVAKPSGEALSPTEEKLVSDLAAQAGLVLRNVRLTAELMDRLQELRASRQRLITAQDTERRRLERDLHDGAQQQLVALKVKLGLARTVAQREGAEKTVTVLDQLSSDADEAVTTLRDLARGIYPPLLASEGLPTALTAQARKAAVAVSVSAEGVGRYHQDVEAAVYFCCLEALQNIAKHAGATQAWIALSHDDGTLAFTIRDDGQGFDSQTAAAGAGLTNMADRLDALGGSFAVASRPGDGTTISARIPAPAPLVDAARSSAR